VEERTGKQGMTSRERVIAALQHREPDRVPIDCGGTLSSISQFAYRRLLRHLGLGHLESSIVINDGTQQLAVPQDEVLKIIGADVRHIQAGAPDGFEPITISGNPNDVYAEYASGGEQHAFQDEWGVVWRRAAYYYDMVKHPLAEATLEGMKAYRFPDPENPGRFRGLNEKAKALYENTSYAIHADQGSGGILEMALWTRGFEEFYMDLASKSPFADILLDRVLEYLMAFYDKYLESMKPYVQIVSIGDDYAMQDRLLISPTMWREMVKPRYARLLQFIKSKADVYCFHHSCGAIVPIVDDLIEIGVDVLNPTQPRAKGMWDSRELKKRFGDRITFHGGIDEQQILPHGTPEQVEEEVKRRVSGFGPGGGYVLAAAHNVQADVPPENILAMYKSAQKYGQYPIDVPDVQWTE
jgi:uroporphyrinogen decarboxylase